MSDAPPIEQSIAALRHAAAALSQTDDLSTLFDTVGEQVMLVVPYHTLRLFLLDKETQELYPVAIRSVVDDADLAGLDDPRFRLPLGKGVTGSIAARGKAEVVYDLEEHPEAFHIPGTPRVEESMIGVPLVFQGRTLGVLTLSTHGLSQFSEHQLTLMEVLAVSITAAIEHRRSLEAEQRALEQEQRLHHLHTTFIANVSHELRTPLTTIKGFLELAKGKTTNGTAEIIEGAQRGAERLHSLIEDLLEIVSIEAGRQRLEPALHDLRDLLNKACERMRVSAERLDISGLPAEHQVFADRDRTTNILAELIENADKYGPDGGKIRVGVERRDATDIIEVSDDGNGIPPEQHEDIFSRFTQGDSSATRRRGGTGIGLSLARSLARWHGGDLVYDADAQRTTFRLTLPAPPESPTEA